MALSLGRIGSRASAAHVGPIPEVLQDPREPGLCQQQQAQSACVASWCVLQESQVANRIKEAFFSERGLAGNVHRLPFDKLFAIDSVKKV
jgi:hypothetical protein